MYLKVLVSFIFTACTAYLIVLGAYYFLQAGFSAHMLNKLDGIVAEVVRKPVLLVTTTAQKSRIVRRASHIAERDLLRKVLISFSDQQLVTGFAMLVVGYAQIDTIAEYHFDIVDSLTTLAFVVHDCSSNILRDDVLGANTAVRAWRAAIILCYMTLSLVTEIPFGNEFWLQSYGMATKCVWINRRYNLRTRKFWNMLINIGLQAWGICSTFNDYFPKSLHWAFDNRATRTVGSKISTVLLYPRRLYYKSSDSLENANGIASRALFACLTWSSHVAAVSVFVICEVLQSQAFELQRHWVLLLNSIYYIFVLRNTASSQGRDGDENAWGFGQAVPVFLLVLPLSIVIGSVYGE